MKNCFNCYKWRHDGMSDMGVCASQERPTEGAGFIIPVAQAITSKALREQCGNGLASTSDSVCNLFASTPPGSDLQELAAGGKETT